MIRWLVQTIADYPHLSAGRPPAGLLAPVEAEQYESFLSPRRRRDWLLGRWTAKRLAQAHIASTQGFSPALDSLTIDYDRCGAPYIAGHHPALLGPRRDGRIPLALSIGHSGGYAFCAICDNHAGEVRLGADIELVEERPDTLIEEFFTAAERANLHAAPPAQHDLPATATWSAKEATLKATHLALRTDPRSVECLVQPTSPRHWTPLRVKIEPALRAALGVNCPLRVWWRVIDNRLRPGTSFVLTLAAFGADL